MKLNHLDLQVRDVQRAVSFFERFFDFELQSSRNSPATAILSDRHGFTLVLQHQDAPSYPDRFHLGFFVDDVQAVIDVQARWRAAGLEASDVIENGRGTMAYCRTPEGYMVEINCRRARPPRS